jgi:PAS domain S-box-containing protein
MRVDRHRINGDKTMEQRRILIVEDEAIIAMNLEMTLRNNGYDIVGTAATAGEAIEAAMRERPDLVLMDIIIIGEMDGVEAVREIRSRLDVAIVYMTAHSDPATLKRARDTEPHGYIIKPAGQNELLSAVDIALYKHDIERRMRLSEERYRTLFENSKNAIAIYRAGGDGDDFIIVDFNRAAEEIENVECGSIVGKSVREVFPGVVEFGIFDVFKRVHVTGNPEKHDISFYRDGRISGWRDNYVYRLPSGEIVAIYTDETQRKMDEEEIAKKNEELESANEELHATIEELEAANEEFESINEELTRTNTDLEKAHAELARSEEHYRIITEMTSDYIFILGVGSNGDITLDWVTDNFYAITGRSLDEVRTMSSWMTIFDRDDLPRVKKALSELVVPGHEVEVECGTFLKDGRKRRVIVKARSIESLEEGRVSSIIGAVKDAGDRGTAG